MMGSYDDHCDRTAGLRNGMNRGDVARRRWERWILLPLLLSSAGLALATETPHGGAFDPPVVDADAAFAARRARVWSDVGGQYVLLHGDVTFAIGNYGFTADAAMVRIETEVRVGRRVRHLALFLQHAEPGRGGGATWAEARRLLVTVSTTGRIELACDLMEPVDGPVDDSRGPSN